MQIGDSDGRALDVQVRLYQSDLVSVKPRMSGINISLSGVAACPNTVRTEQVPFRSLHGSRRVGSRLCPNSMWTAECLQRRSRDRVGSQVFVGGDALLR